MYFVLKVDGTTIIPSPFFIPSADDVVVIERRQKDGHTRKKKGRVEHPHRKNILYLFLYLVIKV